MDGHPPKRCGGTPESSRLPPPQLGGRRATHFSFRNQPRRSTAVFCQANQKRFSFQVRLTALPKEARGTSPFDGDGHEALESVATQAEHATPADLLQPLALTFFLRLRKFLWLSSGLFSAAALAVPMVGVLAFGRLEGVGPSFLAALASACLFGLASIFHFGPDSA